MSKSLNVYGRWEDGAGGQVSIGRDDKELADERGSQYEQFEAFEETFRRFLVP